MRMTNKNIYIGLAFLLMLMASVICTTRRSQEYYVNVFASEGGWGYDILCNHKMIIHQPYIPAIDGQKPFHDKNTARETGRLVIRKLRSNKSPRIGIEEINKITSGT
jgi:hypothetical protein